MKEILTVDHAKRLLIIFANYQHKCRYLNQKEIMKKLKGGVCYVSIKSTGIDLSQDRYIKSVSDGSYIYPLNPTICLVNGMDFSHQTILYFLNRIKALEYFILAGGYEGLDFSENAIDKIKLIHDTRNYNT